MMTDRTCRRQGRFDFADGTDDHEPVDRRPVQPNELESRGFTKRKTGGCMVLQGLGIRSSE